MRCSKLVLFDAADSSLDDKGPFEDW